MLETPRLILRPFKESDAEAAHVWFSDPEIFRFYTYGPYRSVEETASRIRDYCRQFEAHGFGKWIVIDKASGIPIGDAGLILEEDTGEVHVGYKIARSCWGRGLATEAAQEWVRRGFEELGLRRIAAFIHPQNNASIRVVQKLNFSLCRRRSEAGIDWNVYEVAREAWPAAESQEQVPGKAVCRGADVQIDTENGGKMKRVTGIGGIFFLAKDPAALRAWYKKHLGIDVQEWGGTAFKWADEEGRPATGTTVWSISEPGADSFAPTKAPFMINYRVEDLAALLDALRKEGCNVLEKADDSEYGKFGWVMDPEGNKVELWQPPAGQ